MQGGRTPNGPGAKALAKLRGIRDSSLTLTESSLCIAVVLRENSESGETYISIPALAFEAKIAERTAWRDLATLKRKGVLTVRRRKGQTSLLSVSLSALHVLRRRTSKATMHEMQPTPASDAPQRVHDVQSAPVSHANLAPHDVHPISPQDNSQGELPSSGDARSSTETAVRPDGSSDDDFIQMVHRKLQGKFQQLSSAQLRWAITRIMGRARTRPRSAAFFEKSLPGFFDQLTGEIKEWLVEEATSLLHRDGPQNLADIVEDLKMAAAAHDFSYSGETIGDAIDCALRHLAKEREVQSELIVGRGPVCTHISPSRPESEREGVSANA
jgi:hypothetical protein